MKATIWLPALALALAAATANAQTTSDKEASTVVQTDYNPIPQSVPMLNIAPEARGTSLGDAGVATTPDMYSQYYNPAKYIRCDSKTGVNISITPWLKKIISDINLFDLMGYFQINQRNCVSASIKYFSLGNLELFNDHGDVEDEYSPKEFSVDVAYSLALSKYWSGSIALRYIHSDLGFQVDDDGYSKGNAFAADLAFYFLKPLGINADGGRSNARVAFGFNFSNIGSKISYDNGVTNEYLPAKLAIGAGFWYDFDQFNSLGATLELQKLLVPTPDNTTLTVSENEEEGLRRREKYYSQSVPAALFKSFGDAPRGFKEEMEEIDICAGLEYTYNHMISARFGYHNNPENKGNLKYCTVGVGAKLKMIDIAASYIFAVGNASSNSALANTVRISLGFDIGNILGTNSTRHQNGGK